MRDHQLRAGVGPVAGATSPGPLWSRSVGSQGCCSLKSAGRHFRPVTLAVLCIMAPWDVGNKNGPHLTMPVVHGQHWALTGSHVEGKVAEQVSPATVPWCPRRLC